MKLHEILRNPLAMQFISQRACGDAGIPLGPHVALPPIASKWPVKQVTNTEPATQAQQEHAQGRGEDGNSGRK